MHAEFTYLFQLLYVLYVIRTHIGNLLFVYEKFQLRWLAFRRCPRFNADTRVRLQHAGRRVAVRLVVEGRGLACRSLGVVAGALLTALADLRLMFRRRWLLLLLLLLENWFHGLDIRFQKLLDLKLVVKRYAVVFKTPSLSFGRLLVNV